MIWTPAGEKVALCQVERDRFSEGSLESSYIRPGICERGHKSRSNRTFNFKRWKLWRFSSYTLSSEERQKFRKTLKTVFSSETNQNQRDDPFEIETKAPIQAKWFLTTHSAIHKKAKLLQPWYPKMSMILQRKSWTH